MCLTLISYTFGLVFKWSLTCDAENNSIIRRNLAVQAVVFVFLFSGLFMFHKFKESYEKEHSTSLSYRGSSIVVTVVCAIEVFVMCCTASPVFERCCAKCRNKPGNNNTGGNASSTNGQTTSQNTTPAIPAASAAAQAATGAAATSSSSSSSTSTTTTVTVTTRKRNMRTVGTSTTYPDLSAVEGPRPPSYNEICANFMDWYELNAGNTADTTEERDRHTRTCSADNIFTVVVNPAPPQSEAPNPLLSSRLQPQLPPPRYEDVSSSLPPLRVDYPFLPPPSYESSVADSSATGSAATTRAELFPLDTRLLFGAPGDSRPPPSHSDA
ncbi:hypothetical protein PoB_003204800 [Plakobranchus ocellatus]|uniref:Uncharacterized protein n=1 Tax=Plakobranchus ocellatus TaxID=259542 RepID=A0AAV4AE68_9GAST|nr:hypothetical protein PoB_003204800 [Plakobranchus ocellatus]